MLIVPIHQETKQKIRQCIFRYVTEENIDWYDLIENIRYLSDVKVVEYFGDLLNRNMIYSFDSENNLVGRYRVMYLLFNYHNQLVRYTEINNMLMVSEISLSLSYMEQVPHGWIEVNIIFDPNDNINRSSFELMRLGIILCKGKMYCRHNNKYRNFRI